MNNKHNLDDETLIQSLSFIELEDNIKNKKPKNQLVKFIIAFIITLSIFIGLFCVYVNQKSNNKVNLSKMVQSVSVSFEGYDGYGTADLEFDQRVLEYFKEIDIDLESKINAEPKAYLANGNKVTLQVILNQDDEMKLKKAGVVVDNTKYEYEVRDLPHLKKYNVFDKTAIHFEGDDGSGTVKIQIDPSFKSALKVESFKFESNGSLSNQDIVVIEYSPDEEEIKEMIRLGYEIESSQAEYTIIGLSDKTLTDLRELVNIDQLKLMASNKIDADYKKNRQKYDDFKIKSTCTSMEPQNNVNYEDYTNGYAYNGPSVMFIFEFKQNSKKKMFDAYGFTNLYIKEGHADIDTLKHMSPYQSNATLSFIKNQMKFNNFICD